MQKSKVLNYETPRGTSLRDSSLSRSKYIFIFIILFLSLLECMRKRQKSSGRLFFGVCNAKSKRLDFFVWRFKALLSPKTKNKRQKKK